MAWHWYDFVYAPWTVGKFIWEAIKPQKNQEPGRPPQVSAQGGAIPIVFGKTRITGDIIYFSCDSVVTSVGNYWNVAAIIALCEGPIAGVARCWRDKTVFAAPADGGWYPVLGTRPTQTPWTAPPSAKQLGYPGIAYLVTGGRVAEKAWQGLGQSSFEVQGLLHGTGDATKGDADPSQIIDVMLRDRVAAGSAYGVGLAVPFSVRVATGRDGTAASSYARHVSQEAYWLSPAFTDRRPAAEHLKDILEATNATCLWTGGVLEIVPLGDSITGTFSPYVTAQYALTPNGMIDGRVELELGAEADVYNVCPVEFLDREPTASTDDAGHAYNVAIESDPEPVDSASRDERRADAVAMHAICRRDVALKISRIRAQQLVRVRNRYRFKLPWRFARLEPLDFVTLTDERLGMSAVPVRIEQISEDDEHGLDVTAIEWPFGIGKAIAHTTSSSDSPLPDLSAYAAGQYVQRAALSNWQPSTSPSADSYVGGHYANGRLLLVGGGKFAWSEDFGATWTTGAMPGSGDILVRTDTQYVAISSAGQCATSSDGKVWTLAAALPAGTYYCAVWTGSVVMAMGTKVVTSPDGAPSWTTQTGWPGYGRGIQIFSAVWDGAIMAATTNDSDAIYTSDATGTAWEVKGSRNGSVIVRTETGWCVYGSTGGIGVSNDLNTWTTGTKPVSGDIQAMTFTGLVTVGSGYFGGTAAGVVVSTDGGRTWTHAPIPGLTASTYAVVWTGIAAFVTGAGGYLGRSNAVV